VVALLALASNLQGHGDLHEQIDAVTAKLETGPPTADLYFKRAELHRLHEEWQAAAFDYDRAERLGPNLIGVRLGRGKMLWGAGRLEDAKSELNAVLAVEPQHIDALITLGRVESKSGNHLAAAETFGRAIARSPRLDPDIYMEKAEALVAAGESHIDKAVECLDEGIAQLGKLPSLGLRAVDLQVRRKRFDDALKRLDALSAGAPRKEGWLERKGDILAEAGKMEEAREVYHAAKQEIAKLPNHLRGTKSARELAERVENKANGQGERAGLTQQN
jgi:tetratricopeptide (TPR) repeat protein